MSEASKAAAQLEKKAAAGGQGALEALIEEQASDLKSTYWKRDRPRVSHDQLCKYHRADLPQCKRLVQPGGQFCGQHLGGRANG